MSIEAQVLDYRQDGNSYCYLTKFSLYDYLSLLPENYEEYDVQREIVSSNVYLDKIIDTVLNKYHIPPIVLISTKDYKDGLSSISLSESDYKILDGLQRTHRLKAIFDTYKLFLDEVKRDQSILTLSKFQLSRKYSQQLNSMKSNYSILNKIMNFYEDNKRDEDSLKKVFTENVLWFEIWTNITESQEIEKMLLLNAGHKPVKLKHQLELLFINNLLKVFRTKEGFSEFKLIREKERNSTTFSKNRKYGEFHFSQLISAIIAFDKGKLVVTNANLISNIQDNDFVIQELNSELSYKFLNEFVRFLLNLDQIIKSNSPNDDEIKWLGRETSLVGLFAALGNYKEEQDITDAKEVFDKLIQYLKKYPNTLNLSTYDEARKSLDLSKINYGNANRKVVYDAICNLLKRIDTPDFFEGEIIVWENYFQKINR